MKKNIFTVSPADLEHLIQSPSFVPIGYGVYIVICPYCGTKNNFILRSMEDNCSRCGGPLEGGLYCVGYSQELDKVIYVDPKAGEEKSS